MATLRKQKVKKYTYWQIVESKRVNGKPRPFVLAHLGTAEQLLYKLTSGPLAHTIRSVSHGAVNLLFQAAQFLKLPQIYDQGFSRQHRDGLSVGQSLLAASIHRAIHPGSKRSFAFWARQTSLPELLHFDPDAIDSQHFWDQMESVSEAQLQAVEKAVTQKMVSLGLVTPQLLYYDLTNFFTYIDTRNEHTEVAQRGHNKQKRMDLRQFGLSQVVTEEFLLPVYSSVYAGNVHDTTLFLPFLTKLRRYLTELQLDLQDITLVFDKGSNSKENFAELDDKSIPYVGSVVASYYPDLLEVPRSSYKTVLVGNTQVPCFRTTKEVWGAERTVVVCISEKLKAGQIRGFLQTLEKKEHSFAELNEKLQNPRSKKRTKEELELQIANLLKREKVDQVLKMHIHAQEPGRFTLSWERDKLAYDYLTETVFGKRVLVTSRAEWSNERIIAAYIGQHHVERVFKHLKNPYHHSVRPQFHWTDQKIKVHTFICIMGLLLSQVLHKQAAACGSTVGLEHLLDELGTIRKAEIVTIKHLKAKPVKTEQLEQMSPELEKLYKQILNSLSC
ncbi:MAG: IS1634 family transposase [Spirochaetes bacterium]|nr:IS1634 family transposase [Spirochaetota bacterium]